MSADIERWPPPNDSTAFESFCLELWGEIWQDPSAQKNGRSGQSQAGVDVFGQLQGTWVGVQCKQKDGLLWSKLTVEELEREVEAAKQFNPSLAEFILATTGPRDAKVQKRAREITEEHKHRGLFSVVVWSWEDIWDELYRREDLQKRIVPTYWPRLFAARRSGETQIAPTRLSRGAEKLIGRDDDLKRIDAASLDQRTRILTIVAWGGVGKTSLVVEWLNRKAAENWPGFERVFDWSFYSQGSHEQRTASADLFVAEALKFFGDEAMANSSKSPWDKGARLVQLIAAKRALLVLDGLECLQHPPGPLGGQLKDPAIEALLKGLARQKNSGLCIITTRTSAADLLSFRGTTAPEWELKHLATAAGVELLTTLGVRGSDSEFEQLVKDVRGHALTLNLLGRYLTAAHGGDIRRRDHVKLEEADAEMQGGHAFRVMQAYERWFERNGCHAELGLLRLFGLFDRPATPDCLGALRREPVIPFLTDHLVPLTEAQWKLTVTRLVQLGLVEEQSWEPYRIFGYGEQDAKMVWDNSSKGSVYELGQPKPFELPTSSIENANSIDTHPLIREFFAKRLREISSESSRTAHSRLFEHLRASVPYWPEGLNGLQPLYQAVVHGCEAWRYSETLENIYRCRILRGCRFGIYRFYSLNLLGAHSSDLSAVADFFRVPWTQPAGELEANDQVWLFQQAGVCLRALGRLAEALEPARASVAMAAQREDWENAGINSANLIEIELTIGDVAEAVRDAKQGVEFADRINARSRRQLYDRQLYELGNRAILANTLHEAGHEREARELFDVAEDMQRRFQPPFPLLYSLLGFQFCDLLLSSCECAAWRHFLEHAGRSSQSLSAPESTSSIPPIRETQVGCTSPHGNACYEVEQRATQTLAWAHQELTPHFDIALDRLTFGRVALYRAILNATLSVIALDSLKPAAEHLEAAIDLLRQAGRLDYLPAALITRAWLRVLQVQPNLAQEDLNVAWEIAERGPMRLHMANIYLHRARLFRDKENLEQARKLIERCGYWRRKQELDDAEVTARHDGEGT